MRSFARRSSLRLADYDYRSAGGYFVTICTLRSLLMFDDGTLKTIAADCWQALPTHFPFITLDAWVSMPNHMHGIVFLADDRAQDTHSPSSIRTASNPNSVRSPQRGTLSVVVRTYKAAVTTRARSLGFEDFAWQRGFYDHIIRDVHSLERIRQYVRENPIRWREDRFYVDGAR